MPPLTYTGFLLLADLVFEILYHFFLGAALFGPLLLVPLEAVYAARGKPFYDKLSLQLLQALACAAVLSCLFGVARGLFVEDGYGLVVVLATLWYKGAGLLLLVPLCLAHQKLRSTPFLRLALVCCFAVFALGSLAQSMLPLFPLPPSVVPLVTAQSGGKGWWELLATIQPLFSAAPLLGLASAAALGQIWLIFRRNRADYGRDYYSFAMRICARQALVWTVLRLVCLAALFGLLARDFPQVFALDMTPKFLAGLFLAPLLACMLWGAASLSASPMRHKPGIILACLMLLLSHWFQPHGALAAFLSQLGAVSQ